MRLIIKTTLLYLLLAVPVFGIGGIITYKLVKKEVRNETDYFLVETFQRLKQDVREGKPLEALNNNKVVIRKLNGMDWEPYKSFSDTLAAHSLLDRDDIQRKYVRIDTIQDAFYYVSLMDILIESDDMYETVVDIITRLFLILGLTLLVFSFLISRWLFRPFKKSLQILGNFDLRSQKPITLPKTRTLEFKKLNEFIEKMVAKARNDYRSLKEFTENASHEMQTPIAVTKGRLELLMQLEDCSEEQSRLLQSAYDSVSRLSKIGQSLSLLTRIDNKEFSNQQTTNLSAITNNVINNFEELAFLKGLEISKEVQPDVEKKIDSTLADILVTNLLKNAIQHNVADGWVNISLSDSTMIIRNSGDSPEVTPEQLFDRFRKGNQSGGSLGLGLAIVKKICEASNWDVQYIYTDATHQVRIVF